MRRLSFFFAPNYPFINFYVCKVFFSGFSSGKSKCLITILQHSLRDGIAWNKGEKYAFQNKSRNNNFVVVVVVSLCEMFLFSALSLSFSMCIVVFFINGKRIVAYQANHNFKCTMYSVHTSHTLYSYIGQRDINIYSKYDCEIKRDSKKNGITHKHYQ